MLSTPQVLENYFPEVRAWLIQVAAVMDRLDRAAEQEGRSPTDDPRLDSYQQALKVLMEKADHADRAERIQRIFSDPV